MAQPFFDTNILLRHFLQDHPDQSPRATAYLQRIEQGEQQVVLSDVVVFETVFLLERRYRQPRARIQELVLDFLELPSVTLPGKRRYRAVFALYVNHRLPFADAYHVVLMRQLNLTDIVTFDQEFDTVPGIKRLEP
jgi:predicted nucleic acid-binding protein